MANLRVSKLVCCIRLPRRRVRGIGSSSSGPARRVVDPEERKRAGKKENRVDKMQTLQTASGRQVVAGPRWLPKLVRVTQTALQGLGVPATGPSRAARHAARQPSPVTLPPRSSTPLLSVFWRSVLLYCDSYVKWPSAHSERTFVGSIS
jgi:hypothetical protein